MKRLTKSFPDVQVYLGGKCFRGKFVRVYIQIWLGVPSENDMWVLVSVGPMWRWDGRRVLVSGSVARCGPSRFETGRRRVARERSSDSRSYGRMRRSCRPARSVFGDT
jgi:hypothetical protein